MASPALRKNGDSTVAAIAIALGGAAVALGSQFSWFESTSYQWVGRAPLSSTWGPGTLQVGGGIGLEDRLPTAITHFRPVLVCCGILLVAAAVAMASREVNGVRLALGVIALSMATAACVTLLFLEAFVLVRPLHPNASLDFVQPGMWIAGAGAAAAVVGAVWIGRARFWLGRGAGE